MTMPAILPDWVPMWAQAALLVLAMLFAVALLMMPFAVFGLKGRFDLLEAQLDDIHAELRMLAMRLPDAEPSRLARRSAASSEARRAAADTQGRTPAEPDDDDRAAPARRPVRAEDRTRPLRASDDGDRSEPRLRWPPGVR
jgi:hypothetical protein